MKITLSNFEQMNMRKNILIISLSTLILTGCGESKNDQKDKNEELQKDEMHEDHSMGTLPVEKRIAFMSGHVEVGLALYRAGKPDQAAQHLMHPVSEMHQAERAGIDALGFNPEVFKSVSRAMDDGKPASEIEPMLTEAEENITLLQKNAGGDLKEIISFLMETCVEEYSAGVSDGKIVESGEYQDAFGFSMVALKISKRMEGDKSAQLIKELIKLVDMWPEGGPLADSTPEPVEDVVAQTNNVIKNL
tara:strand:+ start:183 stop:926 length:744 start_codon:yes stop_codon:yes gene_type:complete